MHFFSDLTLVFESAIMFPAYSVTFEKRLDEKVHSQIGCFSTTKMEEISINELSHLEREIVNNNMIGSADRRDSFLRAW